MIYSKLTSNRYYITQKDETVFVKIPYWQYTPINYPDKNNFYFLLNNFFISHKNSTSLLYSSSINTNVNFFLNLFTEKNSFPSNPDYFINDFSFFNDFLYIRNSSFIKFFINNMIDVPICFKKSKSLKLKNFELPLLKFSNFLMWDGKREKIIRIVFNSFRMFFNNITINEFNVNNINLNWLNLYIFTNNFYWNLKKNEINKFSFFFEDNISLKYDNLSLNKTKILNISFFLKNYFYSLISKVSPIFSYFIYSVDKNIRKYSRGKSGKYVFIWKFVAPYKRAQLAIRWLMKDIKFYQSRNFSDRLLKTFENLYFSTEKSFSWRSKIFSHNYVFKNFRKSLMSSLRTTS